MVELFLLQIEKVILYVKTVNFIFYHCHHAFVFLLIVKINLNHLATLCGRNSICRLFCQFFLFLLFVLIRSPFVCTVGDFRNSFIGETDVKQGCRWFKMFVMRSVLR